MTTLRQYLDKNRCADDLKKLIELIAQQAIPIRRAFIANQNYADTENIYGEQQAALDKWADIHIINVLRDSKLVAEIASEEQPDIVKIPEATSDYAVVMDPLDGSSLIQVNLCVGTIIGIYENGSALQKGKDLTAAMYMLYGPMTVLTLTIRKGVCIFALNEEREYILMEEGVKMPEGNLYGTGGLKPDWLDYHAEFIRRIENAGSKLRYSGSFVADFHQILKYGGIYCYPAVKGKEKGKLRLVFEANPLGFIAEQAGGAITDGKQNLLEVKPDTPDQKTPVYVGSRGMINKIKEIVLEYS